MLKITFLPDSDLYDYSLPINEYEQLWKIDGNRIIVTLEKFTGYTFQETWINAVIHKRGSQSHPLCLKADATFDEKKVTFIHEMAHRIIYPTLVKRFKRTKIRTNSLENHKVLDLFLYDVFVELYGKEFADFAVKWDSDNLASLYKEAWEYALSFQTKEERQIKLKELLS